MNLNLHIVEETASTNADVRRALEEGAPEGYAVMARMQTGGYGRRGNAWASPKGGLYLSLLLRPTRPLADWPTLSLLSALAVLRAVEGAYAPQTGEGARAERWGAAADPRACVDARAKGSLVCVDDPLVRADGSLARALDLRIKPPNDVIVGTQTTHPLKLAGILPETHAGGVALGFGVNIRRPREVAVVEGKNTPVYLEELLEAQARSVSIADASSAPVANKRVAGGVFSESNIASSSSAYQLDVAAFAKVLLETFEKCYSRWLQNGFEPFEAEYLNYATDKF